MNASLLLELAREWLDISDIARRSAVSMTALDVPAECVEDVNAISRRAIELVGKLEELARKLAEDSRRD